MKDKEKFLKELKELLNRHNAEADSNTPDFILAIHLLACLETFNVSTQGRTDWFNMPTPKRTKE